MPSWRATRCVPSRFAPGDTVVYSSRIIPGNDKAIIDIQNLLIEQGVRIVDDHEALVHVSGHPRRSELKRLYEWVRPQVLVPVHGEAAHLVAQGSLAAMSGIPFVAQVRNGDMLRLAPGAPEIIDQVPYGRVYKDGKLFGDEEAMGVRDRRRLSFAGHVAVNVVLDDRYELAGDPDLVAVGVARADPRGEPLEDIMLDAAIGAIELIPRVRRKDLDLVSRIGASGRALGRRPELGQEADRDGVCDAVNGGR